MMRYCGQCDNFTNAGDWNLCCNNPPEKYRLPNYPCGFVVYAHTEANDCENFEPDVNKCNKCTYEVFCQRDKTYKCFRYHRDAPDGGYYG